MRVPESIPFSSLAALNPATDLSSLGPEDFVSFIPMGDVTEDGQWQGRAERQLKDVTAGYTRFAEGDVLFAKITPCMENGKGAHALGLASGFGLGSTEFHVLRATDGADSRFIYHWSRNRHLRKAAEAKMSGSAGQRRVPAGFFDRFEVPRLPLPEQRRVARILDAVDNAIRLAEGVIDKLQLMKQGLVADVLTRGVDEKGELRDAMRHPAQFKDTRLGRIPVEWEMSGLEQVLRQPPTNGLYKPALLIGSGVAMVGQTAIGPDQIVSLRAGRRATCTAAELRRFGLQDGDILVRRVFATVEGVGRAAFVPQLDEPAVFESNMMLIRVDRAVLLPELVFEWLGMAAARRWISARAKASNQASIDRGTVESLPVLVPRRHEQERIAEVLQRVKANTAAEERSLEKLRLLKAGLMDDLLTGRVRVTGLEESI